MVWRLMWRDGQLIVRTTTILTKKTQTLVTYAGSQPRTLIQLGAG